MEAARDIFLMPSRFEPSGLSQMYSQRYGSVPIVRKTGGLADTVQLFDPASGEGTGFVFDHYDSHGLVWALKQALKTYRNTRAWHALRRNGMLRDYSWDKQSGEYERLYRQLLG
jgi:starch synthase